MKRKADFITNSSSTSFIITSNDEKLLKVPMTIEVDLNQYIDKKITTIEELKKYWLEDRYEDEEDEEYIKCKKKIEAGDIVYCLHCSDEDDPLEAVLCREGINNLNMPKGITIITGEGGY
jgi:hypothetical protein